MKGGTFYMIHLSVANSHLWADYCRLIGWLACTIFVVLMIKRGGGKAEKFLLAGCSLIFLSYILGIPVKRILVRFVYDFKSHVDVVMFYKLTQLIAIPASILEMFGFFCLFYAYWIRWTTLRVVQDQPVDVQ
jgi:hypothetical protein